MSQRTRITHDPVGLDVELRASRDASVLALEAARDRQRGSFQPPATQPPAIPPSTRARAETRRSAEVAAAPAPAHSRRQHPRWHEMRLDELDTY